MPPFLSVCIPQYGRSRHLMAVLDSLKSQTFRDFEVVISDDHSKDDTATVIPRYLADSGLQHRFVVQPQNLGYDANLRAALGLGEGEYLLILGNDDALADDRVLQDIAQQLETHRPHVVITNYRAGDDPLAEPVRRVQRTELRSGGVATAIQIYRSFSFVAGLLFRREAFARWNTERHDGSVFVQAYLGTRIVAAGGSLLLYDRVAIAKDVAVDQQTANSYKDVLRTTRWSLEPNSQGVASIATVAYCAIEPHLPAQDRSAVIARLFRPLLSYSYPYWLFEHRRHGFRRAAVNMALGCAPPVLLRGVAHTGWATLALWPHYCASTIIGFLAPIAVYDRVKGWTYRRSKRMPPR